MKIVVNTNDRVIAWNESITIVNAQGEEGLIKVGDDNSGFYYIGTSDRDLYHIYTVDNLPVDIGEFLDSSSREGLKLGTKDYTYVDGTFTRVN